jgi:hypothetical protein
MRPVRSGLPVFALALALAAPAAMAATATPAVPAAPRTAAAPPAPPPDSVLRQKIVGSWGQSAACKEGRLTFNSDGTFASKGTHEKTAVTGTYTIDQDRLSGRNGDNTMPVMLVDFDGDTLLLDDGSGKPERLARCLAP